MKSKLLSILLFLVSSVTTGASNESTRNKGVIGSTIEGTKKIVDNVTSGSTTAGFIWSLILLVTVAIVIYGSIRYINHKWGGTNKKRKKEDSESVVIKDSSYPLSGIGVNLDFYKTKIEVFDDTLKSINTIVPELKDEIRKIADKTINYDKDIKSVAESIKHIDDLQSILSSNITTISKNLERLADLF